MHIIFAKIPSTNLKLHMHMRNDLIYMPLKELLLSVSWL